MKCFYCGSEITSSNCSYCGGRNKKKSDSSNSWSRQLSALIRENPDILTTENFHRLRTGNSIREFRKELDKRRYTSFVAWMKKALGEQSTILGSLLKR